jgi:hypothetical protein
VRSAFNPKVSMAMLRPGPAAGSPTGSDAEYRASDWLVKSVQRRERSTEISIYSAAPLEHNATAAAYGLSQSDAMGWSWPGGICLATLYTRVNSAGSHSIRDRKIWNACRTRNSRELARDAQSRGVYVTVPMQGGQHLLDQVEQAPSALQNSEFKCMHKFFLL